MYKNKRISLIIPAFNESSQIEGVISQSPDFVDHIIVINDGSTDDTEIILNNLSQSNSKLHTISLKKNSGAGKAVAEGYKYVINKNLGEIFVTIDGDGQMDPNDITRLLDPIVDEKADFTKGNRFSSGEAWKVMPKIRFLGNAFLSFITKIASGYWHVADYQTGFTAINSNMAARINWDLLYGRYGYPNHRLILLNVENAHVKDVPIKPIYNVGEKSGIKIWKVIFTMSFLLKKKFFWRMKEKYVIRDFHPLVLFYLLGFVFFFISIAFFIRLCFFFFLTDLPVPTTSALVAMFSFMSSSQFILFAMWFDMEANKELK